MFGHKIDYLLLRPLTHQRNRATKVQLDAAAISSSFSIDEAIAYLTRVRESLFCGDLLVDPALSYLDVGCGMGRLSLGLAAAGARKVTGIDILGRNIAEATKLSDSLLPAEQRPTFVHADIHDWTPAEQFDVIIALGALEHIHNQARFLEILPRMLKPGGRCFVSIEPFHSPFGDHMMHFFRLPIPWMGLIFNEKSVLRLRREVFRPDDPAEAYEDIEGGLNLVRYGTYLANIDKAGLRVHNSHINPQLSQNRLLLPLWYLSRLLTSIPYVRDFFVVTDYAELRLRRAPNSMQPK